MHSLGCLMDDPYIDNTTERSMDDKTRKALELAKAAIFRMDIFGNEDEAAAAIDAALSAPAAPVAQGSSWVTAADLAENNAAIREALEAFAADQTGDNAAGIVAAVLDTAPQCAAPTAPVAQPFDKLAALVVELAESVDNIADDVGGSRPQLDILRDAVAVANGAGFADPVEQPLPACHVAVIGDRWDSERLHHVPQLLIEFDPVPANARNTAKGLVDRNSLAKILSGIGQRGA